MSLRGREEPIDGDGGGENCSEEWTLLDKSWNSSSIFLFKFLLLAACEGDMLMSAKIKKKITWSFYLPQIGGGEAIWVVRKGRQKELRSINKDYGFHLHVLIRSSGNTDFSRQIQNLFLKFTKRIKKTSTDTFCNKSTMRRHEHMERMNENRML